MEERRGRYIAKCLGRRLAAAAAAALFCAGAGAQSQSGLLERLQCPMEPRDAAYFERVSGDRRAIEVRRKDAPDAKPECILRLDCEVRARPVKLTYHIERPRNEPRDRMRDIKRVLLEFGDGPAQSCNVTSALKPIPPAPGLQPK